MVLLIGLAKRAARREAAKTGNSGNLLTGQGLVCPNKV